MKPPSLTFRWILPLALATPWIQERVKPAASQDFGAVHALVAKEFEAGHYGAAARQAGTLVTIINAKRREVILQALPAAPEGYKVRPVDPDSANNAMAAGLALAVGSVIEQTYVKQGGNQVDVTITADSPMLQMFQMALANPAMLGPDAELIQYTQLKAVLKKEGNQRTLQIPMENSLIEARVRGENGDFLLGLFNQAAVDRLQQALSK